MKMLKKALLLTGVVAALSFGTAQVNAQGNFDPEQMRQRMMERVREQLADDEISIGDFVLTNGALPAMIIVDAVTRLLPGVLGDDESSHEESFSHGLLEYPHYTRPAEFRGMKVPEILLSGHHAEIAKWRAEQARLRTKNQRPDLLAGEGDKI